MNKTIKILILGACIIVVLLLALIFLPAKTVAKTVCFKEPTLSEKGESKGCFDVEVVSTPKDMERGLMFRNHLDKDKGMFFVFEKEGNYPFWMKNTLIPLDIIWINQNQEIVFIKENAQPCRQADCPLINPNQKAKYVLEINGGIAKETNLKMGDRVEISNF